jgi:hypothetical protein
MNQTAMLPIIVPVAGVSEGIAAGLKASWGRSLEDTTREAALARAVAQFSLSNAELLATAAQCRPPQSWYDEDHEGLY